MTDPIDPISIPHYTGELGELEKAVASLKTDASDIRATGADTHSTFQHLSADYDAPERDQLLATTIPVRDQADQFARGLETVQSALSTYASEIRPIVKELDHLREQAVAFRDSVKDDEHWQKNQGKVDENARLIRAVAVAQEKFHAAERDAVNKITAVYCGTTYLTVDDGSHKPGMYGYDPKAIAKVTETPWGTVEKREHGALEKVWDHLINNPIADAYKGFFIDGTWGSVRGLGTMFGWDGGDKAAEAWKNLGLLAAGANPSMFLAAQATRVMPDSWLPKQAREYKKAAKAADKGFLAWDEWKKNPSRAFGALSFNVITALIPEAKAAGLARTGTTTGKVLGTTARVGEIADPVNLMAKGVGKGFTAAKGALESARIGDLHKVALQNAAHLTERIPGTNEKALKLTTADETPTYIREDGTWLRADGSEYPTHSEVPKELSAAERGAGQAHRVLAHVGGGGASESAARIGGHGTGGAVENSAGHASGRGTETSLPSGGRGTDNIAREVGSGPHGSDGYPGSDHQEAPTGSHDHRGSSHGDPGRHTDDPSAPHEGGEDGAAADAHGAGDHGGGTQNGNTSELDAREVVRRQVEKANSPDKTWFNNHYKKNAYRHSRLGRDEHGHALVQLRPDPDRPGKWIPASEAPPAIPPKFRLDVEGVLGERKTAFPEHLGNLDDVTARRESAIAADKTASSDLKAAEDALAADKHNEDLKVAAADAKDTYRTTHTAVRDVGEELGDKAAEFHAVPENFDVVRRVDNRATGNNRFDQVWELQGDKILTVEAKAPSADLGHRRGHSGRDVMQGTREYYETILLEMQKRASNPKLPADELLARRKLAEAKEELALMNRLLQALEGDRVEYVVVKAKADGPLYKGYDMQHFDIRKGSHG